MSLDLIRQEIRRFLASNTPEILCIKGKWGVGKTYTWKTLLAEARGDDKVACNNSAYVSLFGLDSLDDLRNAILTKSVFDDNDDDAKSNTSSYKERYKKFKTEWGQKLNSLKRDRSSIGQFLISLGLDGAGSVFAKSAFLMVRQQIICFDDLERAGANLEMRSVLGLASVLKEDRDCKIVLLLNDKQLDDNATEFSKQLEKVADVTLTFDLSSIEAVDIALIKNNSVIELLKPRIIQLSITNIRVIMKIERLAIRLAELLDEFDRSVLEQAINTLVLGSWAAQQQYDGAPSLDFVKKYNKYLLQSVSQEVEIGENERRWLDLLDTYPYSSTDEMDMVILDGTADGFFNIERLRSHAQTAQTKFRQSSRENSFSKAWDELFHGSLSTDDDVFLDALYVGAKENLGVITPMNMNSTVRMMRQFGREQQADDLIAKYVDNRSSEGPEFFDLSNQHFMSNKDIDPNFRIAFDQKWTNFEDDRDPLTVLKSMGEKRFCDELDFRLMERQTVDEFENMFEELRGDDLRRSMDVVLSASRSKGTEPDSVFARISEALRRIAAKSAIRREKIMRYQKYGVEVDGPANNSNEDVTGGE